MIVKELCFSCILGLASEDIGDPVELRTGVTALRVYSGDSSGLDEFHEVTPVDLFGLPLGHLPGGQSQLLKDNCHHLCNLGIIHSGLR